MDCTTHREEYLRLSRQYLADAKAVLRTMRHHFWVRPGLELLETVQGPARHPKRLQRAGWELLDYADEEGCYDGYEGRTARALVEIGECCLPGGYTDDRALERLREHLEELGEAKRLFLKS